MRRIPPFAALFALLVVLPVLAGSETVVIDPLPDKDISYFKQEGTKGWRLDLERDDVHNLLVCDKVKDDSWILWNRKPFKNTFEVRFEAEGGSKMKGLQFYVFPPKGDRVQIPFSTRLLGKKGWHKLVFLVDEGKAVCTFDKEKQDPVDVPSDQELTFGLKLPKRNQAAIKKMKIRYLVVTEKQKAPEEGFVRIFDGQSLDGWQIEPAGSDFWKLTDERIEGKVPQNQQNQPVIQYTDGRFQNFVLRFSVGAPCRGLRCLARYGVRDQYPASFGSIDGYVPGDQEWTPVELSVNGKDIELKVNGNRVWTDQAKNETPSPILFLLFPGGTAKIRDIRVQGQNNSPGGSWGRYAKESNVKPGAGGGPAAGPGAGGGGNVGGGGGKKIDLFNGTDLDDWMATPADVWSVAAGRILGLTLEKKSGATLRYRKYVFPEYRLRFSIEQGSKGVTFVGKADPHRNHPELAVTVKPEWLGDRAWTKFEATVMDGKFKLKCEDKVVVEKDVFKEAGIIEWRIDPDCALGLKDVGTF